MLKGHIDNVTDDSVSGWIYSQKHPVAGERVLAFCGAQCIGVAEVGIYRDDLFQAGLDDGRLGFQIFFDRAALTDSHSLHVRMEGSDFSLLAKDFWSTPIFDHAKGVELFAQSEIERIEWMASRGWLNQGQFALAKAIGRMGVYQRLFSRKDIEDTSLDSLVREEFADCLSILLKLAKKTVMARLSVSEVANNELNLTSSFPGIIGFYGANFSAKIQEGRHRADMSENDLISIFYDNSIYQLMILHVDCCAGLENIEGGSLRMITYSY